MAIMGILAGVVAGAVVGLGSTGQVTRVEGDRNTIGKSADRFFTDSFPQTYPVVDIDTNGDGSIDITDPTFLLSHLFLGGPEPVAPFAGCGTSELETDEELGCGESPCS